MLARMITEETRETVKWTLTLPTKSPENACLFPTTHGEELQPRRQMGLLLLSAVTLKG